MPFWWNRPHRPDESLESYLEGLYVVWNRKQRSLYMVSAPRRNEVALGRFRDGVLDTSGHDVEFWMKLLDKAT